MIEFDHVTRTYGPKTAVSDLSLAIPRGELFALLGPNGAGKTTTIKMLVGLLQPSRGAVRVSAFDLVRDPRNAHLHIGYVPDEPCLYDKLTGREFLWFIADMFGMPRHLATKRIAAEIEHFKGNSGQLLEWMMLQWWHRYGATQASGISKLIMSEATNFPELALFYRQEVIEPGQALVRSVLQRAIDQGEFRPVDVELALHSVMAPLLFLVMWKHSMGPCCPSHTQINPEAFISQHAQLLVRGLSKT